MLGFWNKNFLLFSGPSQGPPWSPSVSKSVFGLNRPNRDIPNYWLIAFTAFFITSYKKHNKTTREFYQEWPFSTYMYKSYVNERKCHIFDTWSEFWLWTWKLHRLFNWLLDQVRTFWAILELVALVPTWLKVLTWSGTGVSERRTVVKCIYESGSGLWMQSKRAYGSLLSRACFYVNNFL